MTLDEFAKVLNIELPVTLERFGGSKELYIVFLKKALNDTTFPQLRQSYAQLDYSQIENLAHTLKGIAANMGLSNLSEASSHLVNAIRQKEYEKLPSLFSDVERHYQEYMDALSLLED